MSVPSPALEPEFLSPDDLSTFQIAWSAFEQAQASFNFLQTVYTSKYGLKPNDQLGRDGRIFRAPNEAAE